MADGATAYGHSLTHCECFGYLMLQLNRLWIHVVPLQSLIYMVNLLVRGTPISFEHNHSPNEESWRS